MNLQQNPRTTLPKVLRDVLLPVQPEEHPTGGDEQLASFERENASKEFDLKRVNLQTKSLQAHEKEKKFPTFKDLDFMELLPDGLLLEPETYTADIYYEKGVGVGVVQNYGLFISGWNPQF